MFHKAFTLIELIFAIVVIAIAVLSLPTMNQTVSKGIESNIVQEAIFAASTELNQAVTYFWDDNSITENDSLARVIWIDDTDCDNDTKLRIGHINQELHRRCNDNNSTRPTHTKEVETPDDLDDIADSSDKSLVIGDITSSGYKDSYSSKLTVTRDADFGETDNNPNIKMIRVEVKNSAGSLVTRLDTYSCNIGEIDYYKRDY